jgi:hypothetical protein
MNTTIEEPKFEILPADVESASTELSCPSDKVAALYQPFAKPFQAAADLLAEEEKAVTAFDARALRLKMVKARTTITATKDESKSDIKLAGNIIDWFHNKGRDRLAAAEARLLDIEKAEERAEAARIEALREERAETLESIGHDWHGISLGTMSDDAWHVYLQQSKDVYEMRQIRAKREAEEALSELNRWADDLETARLETIRLREEAAAAAAALAAERADRAEAEAKAAKEKADAEAAAKAEREKIEAAAAEAAEIERQKALAELAAERAERAKAEAEAAEERSLAMAVAAIEAKKREKAEAEAKALRDAEAKRLADEKAAADAKAKAEAAAAKKSAAAPDREKLMHFADIVRHLNVPLAQSEDGQRVAAEIGAKVENFAKWIETQAASI